MIRAQVVTLCGVLLMMAGCGGRAGGVNIWDAVENGDADGIGNFALANGNLDVRSLGGVTPLWVALSEENRPSYEALLEYGADPNVIMSGKRVVTHWAAMKEDPWWLRLALEHGADPNLVNTGTGATSEGTPLMYAITGIPDALIENVKLLVEYGADIDKPDRYGCPPLLIAANQTKLEIVLYLLDAGADYRAAKCHSESFVERIRNMVENRNRWYRREKERRGVDAIQAWLEDHGEDVGEPLPPE